MFRIQTRKQQRKVLVYSLLIFKDAFVQVNVFVDFYYNPNVDIDTANVLLFDLSVGSRVV